MTSDATRHDDEHIVIDDDVNGFQIFVVLERNGDIRFVKALDRSKHKIEVSDAQRDAMLILAQAAITGDTKPA